MSIQTRKVNLIDAIDRVIDKGAYVDGEIALRIADIDLVFIGLRLLVTSISRVEQLRKEETAPSEEDLIYIQKMEEKLKNIEASLPRVIDATDPEKVEKGIAKLVLTLVEFIRQLLEREAVRRIDKGSLSDAKIQKLGLTFEMLKKKIEELKAVFGIKEELNFELGPLGNLL